MRNRRSLERRRRILAALPLKWDDLELSRWWSSETAEFHKFVLRLLASLPGGDEAEDMGFQPFEAIFGWKEVEMITEMLDKIQNEQDVEQLIQDLVGPDEESI